MAMSSLRLETEHCQVQGSTTPWEGLGEDKNKNMNPQTKGKTQGCVSPAPCNHSPSCGVTNFPGLC